MRKTDKISRFLPMSLGQGDRISKFSKKCPHCGQIVGGEHMVGVASRFRQQIALAASAECPACRLSFPVTCVITADKRVLRVTLPLWLFRAWLQLVSPPAEPPAPMPQEPEPPKSLSLDTVDERANDVVGSYQGQPIYPWIKAKDGYYDFERVFAGPRLERLTQDELLVETCLVYRRR